MTTTTIVMTEEAARRIVAEVERLGTARFNEPDDLWPAWWRGMAYGLETLAEGAWLHGDQPTAAELVRNVAGAVATLGAALSASPPEWAPLSVQATLLRRVLPDADTERDGVALVASALRLLSRAAGELRAAHERLEALAARNPEPADTPADMALAVLAECFDGSFTGRDGDVLRPTATMADKDGPFSRFALAALSEFAAAWREARPGVALPFGPEDVTPGRLRRVTAAARQPS